MSRNLQDELDNTATFWKPEEGDSLVGTVIKFGSFENKYGERKTMTVKDDQGELWDILLGTKILIEELEKAAPGDRVGLKYLGVHPQKGYQRYKVIVEKCPKDQVVS